ncbi:MAG TPA: efflux RND transporter periplasmic adaptor subunit [Rhodocyclaceae bacterium]|nr:efflux RND transporter periplasmic adaptor subunit [Rhodocyclaceae bacterium]
MNRLLLSLALAAAFGAQAADDKPAAPVKPALSVQAIAPQAASLPLRITANGNIAAWQEASIGTEANGLRLSDVRVNVGDVVKKGQVLATFAPAIVQADFMEARAALAQANASLAEAVANARRARELEAKGFISPQKVTEAVTAEAAAQARLDAQKAVLQNKQLRVDQTRVLAPDSGVISARSATVGAVLPAGQELFRLIRQGRLEWRAEVPAADLAKLKPGVTVTVTPAGGSAVKGTVRMVAPTVDPQTRNGLVYVDLPDPGAAKAGMFARGEFELGSANALTLPQSAVVLREGFSYVLRIGQDAKVVLTKVAVGRRSAERIEITGGLEPNAKVVAAGGAFLADGDTVKVVDSPAPAK